MTRRILFLRRLGRNERGATIVEFALIAPVMCMVLLGVFDISHTLYMRGVLQGVVQKTARDSTLESSADEGTEEALDQRVRDQVSAIVNNADIQISRRYYRSLSEAAEAKAEDFTDTTSGVHKNGICDGGEPFEDTNNNGIWDQDGGNGGQGGAKDAVVYTVTVTYQRLFPITGFIGGSNDVKVIGKTILRNQPYGDQGTYAPVTPRNCP